MNIRKLMLQQIEAGLHRKTLETPSKWATDVLGLNYDAHPWERDMINSDALVNIGCKSAQMGYSTAGLVISLFTIDIKKQNCLYLLPTKTPDATDFSSSRFDPMIESSEHLQKVFRATKNVGHKRAGKTNLWIRGMNSRSALKSIDPTLIVFDELDEMDKDKVVLAEFRQSGQKSSTKRLWKISTPTIPEFGIAKVMLESTQEHFFFKCPHCSRQTELLWPDCFELCGENLGDPDLKRSFLKCKECQHELEHGEDGIAKIEWLKTGKWLPTVDNPNWDCRGFYINQLYSTTVSPFEIAQWVIRAKFDVASDQELHNSMMGLPYVGDGMQIDDATIERVKGTHHKSQVPPSGAKVITMGVDPGKWLNYCVCQWTFSKFENDLNMSAHCKVLDEGKVPDYKDLQVIMQTFRPQMTVVDSEPESRLSYEFATQYWGHVKVAKFTKGNTERLINVNRDQNNHYITLDRTSWLDCTLGRFRSQRITLPVDVSEDFKEHVKALVKRYETDSNGNPKAIYLSRGADHSAFALLYAEVALPLAASLVQNQDVARFL